MGFFSKIFKGIKKVVKGIGKVIKKVVKSKAFKVVAAVALAVVAPQLIPTIMKGISTAGAWAANTIATGASAVWSGVQAAGSALMSGAKAVGSFGSKVFSSVTETISNGVNFMKTKLSFGTPSTLTGSSAAATEANIANFFGREAAGSTVAKMTLKDQAYKAFGTAAVDTVSKLAKPITDIAKDPLQKLVVDPLTGMAKQAITGGEPEEDALDRYNEQQRKLSLLSPAASTKGVGDYDSSGGFAPLMSLATNTQSPYISYNQGQQLFGMPEPIAG